MTLTQMILVVFGIWLIVLSVVLFRAFNFFRRLTKKVKKGNLVEVIDKVLEKEAKNSKDLSRIQKEIRELSDEVNLHVQKVGLVRFNPFEEMGGDHSFSLALLDGRDTGVILTGLHTRERTRVYIKEVERGRSKFNLSSEEKKALAKAQKGK
ncbi:DUF4446 family protein [Patescibacteria group bacterium]|nr:DUF4446 family protein [Patescibacteria group bacterium]